MFDEQPDGDPHGECEAEIRRLQRELDDAKRLLDDAAHQVPAGYQQFINGKWEHCSAFLAFGFRDEMFPGFRAVYAAPVPAGVAPSQAPSITDEELTRRFTRCAYPGPNPMYRCNGCGVEEFGVRNLLAEHALACGVKECWACNGTRVVTTSSNGSGLIEAPCANCTDGVSNEALEQHATAPSDETPQLLDKLSDDLWSALSFIDSTVCREEVEKIAMRLDEDRRRIAGVAGTLKENGNG